MSITMNRRQFLAGIAGTTALSLANPLIAAANKPPKRKNVLFIAVDDLRCELGCYGAKHIISPNIDKLAARGLLFERAYCQQAVCSPSRTSLLTGLRPDSAKVWDLFTFFRDTVPDVVTLPQHFKNHGYHTESIGKIAHKSKMQDDKHSWSVKSRRTWSKGYWQSEEGVKIREMLSKRADEKGLKGSDRYYATLGPPVDKVKGPDIDQPDGLAAVWAVESLEKLAKQDKPFFLAAGFFKPHLPFSAPEKYWNLYNRDDIQPPATKNWPQNAPKIAGIGWHELRHYYGMPEKGPVTDQQAKELIHGYYACVSFVDAQIGRLVDTLDRLGIADDTVIILWGDHGWKLGDYGAWCKHTNFELDTRVPMILVNPGSKENQQSKALVEFVDIYPTLAELCDLPVPAHCEGTSMAPLLKKPNRPWKTAAFSQYPRKKDKVMGYSMRTDQWRYTEWLDRKTQQVLSRELYDHRTDQAETVNLGDDPNYAAVVKKLSHQLDKGNGWKKAKPPQSTL